MTKGQSFVVLGALGAVVWWLLRQTAQAASDSAPIATVTTDTTIDLDSLGGLGMTNYSDAIKNFATAIARAEGYFVTGSVPDRANNPGDLKSPTFTFAGEREGQVLGEGIAVFESADAGWNALYRQLFLIVTGQSSVYNLDMTIAQMAERWTGSATEAAAWANNVATQMGVSTQTRLVDVLA